MILDEIVAKRKEQLARELQRTDRETMRKLALQTEREVYSFPDALKSGRLSIIAEVKKASPSKSVICADFHPVEQAAAYERAGADAISCLTEEHYFQGSSDYFRAIREAVSIPMLRKDFIIDTYQIDEARVMGADAILLIAAILDAPTMRHFYEYATELGLHCLFEAHNEAEMEQVLACGAKICGINNRNLKNFVVDFKTTGELMKIKFCGIRRLEDVAAVNLCQPDYMGMILSGGFRRSISQEQAQCLVQEKSDAIAAVGVFVNESSETICRMAEQLHLQVIQLHGNESAEQIQTLQQKTGLPVWKALRIGTLEELEAAGTNPADCLILEGKTGAGIGGTGVCADWELLARHSWNRSFFLAGGLQPENVLEAIATVSPTGVDFSSGIEEDGVKSLRRMKQLMTLIRGA